MWYSAESEYLPKIEMIVSNKTNSITVHLQSAD